MNDDAQSYASLYPIPSEDVLTVAGASLQIEEYRALRAEIVKRQDRKLQITALYTAACGAVWMLLMHPEASQPRILPNTIPFLPLLAVALGTMLIYVEDHAINQLSTYLLVRFEQIQPQLHWESYLLNKRAFGTQSFDSRVRTFVARQAIPAGCIMMTIILWYRQLDSLSSLTVADWAILALAVGSTVLAVIYSMRAYAGRKHLIEIAENAVILTQVRRRPWGPRMPAHLGPGVGSGVGGAE